MFYHEAVERRVAVALAVLLAEGFMRRFDPVALQPQIKPHLFTVTPQLVNISTGVRAISSPTSMWTGSSAWMARCRAGSGQPRWLRRRPSASGQGVADIRDLPTSRVDGEAASPSSPASCRPSRSHPGTRRAGRHHGMNHEAVLYDQEALVETDSVCVRA